VAWLGAWSGFLLPFSSLNILIVSPTVFLPRPFKSASTIVAAPLLLRLARLARRGTNKTPILRPDPPPHFSPPPAGAASCLVPPASASASASASCHRAFLPH
jgi:hypothetical protein